MRLVEFKNAFSYEKSTLMNYLCYFRAVQNIFDLEFFQNKIAS